MQDPFERFPSESEMYFRWGADKLWMFVPAQMVVGQFVQSFKEYPPSQKSGSFSVDQVLDQLQAAGAQVTHADRVSSEKKCRESRDEENVSSDGGQGA